MQFNTSLLLAQSIPSNTYFLGWVISALSTGSSLLIFVTGVLMFIGACYLVSNRRPAASLASYLVLLPIPLFISVCGWICGTIQSLATIASTKDYSAITNQGIAGGLAASLLSILFAILISFPTYILLAYGLIARDFRKPTQGTEVAKPADQSPIVSSIGVNAIPTVQ